MHIKKVYQRLKSLNICTNGYQFSTNCLGMHKSYYGMLLAQKKEPSTTALVNLHESLSHYSEISTHLDKHNPQVASLLLKSITLEISTELQSRGRLNLNKRAVAAYKNPSGN